MIVILEDFIISTKTNLFRSTYFNPQLRFNLLIILFQESLSNYVKGEMLEGDNAYFCEKCALKRNAVKRMCIRYGNCNDKLRKFVARAYLI